TKPDPMGALATCRPGAVSRASTLRLLYPSACRYAGAKSPGGRSRWSTTAASRSTGLPIQSTFPASHRTSGRSITGVPPRPTPLIAARPWRSSGSFSSAPLERAGHRLRGVVELTPIVVAVEVPQRFGNQPIGANPPLLEAADANPTPCTARPCVRAGKSPSVDGPVSVHDQVVHQHLHVGKGRHEPLRHLGDGFAPYRGLVLVHLE